MNYKDWFWLRQKAAFSHPRLNDIIEDGKEYYRVGFSDGATWERNRNEQAYAELKQQADMLYEALKAAKTAVTYAHTDLMDEYYLDAKRYFDRTLKTYKSFIEEGDE